MGLRLGKWFGDHVGWIENNQKLCVFCCTYFQSRTYVHLNHFDYWNVRLHQYDCKISAKVKLFRNTKVKHLCIFKWGRFWKWSWFANCSAGKDTCSIYENYSTYFEQQYNNEMTMTNVWGADTLGNQSLNKLLSETLRAQGIHHQTPWDGSLQQQLLYIPNHLFEINKWNPPCVLCQVPSVFFFFHLSLEIRFL